MDYYDRLLGGMLASLLIGTAVGVYPAVGFKLGLLGGAVGATVFLWDGLVRRPPTPIAEPKYAAAIAVWHAMIGVAFGIGY